MTLPLKLQTLLVETDQGLTVADTDDRRLGQPLPQQTVHLRLVGLVQRGSGFVQKYPARLLQHHPEHPWTVAELATAAGLSRAAFARRFTDVVGEPPMTFLTGWRLALAADLLREPGATLASVARQVGYSTPFALSTAFKRQHGVSPRDHRALTA